MVTYLGEENIVPGNVPFTIEGLVHFSDEQIEHMKNEYQWSPAVLRNINIDINQFGKISNNLYTNDEYFKSTIKTNKFPSYTGNVYVDFDNKIMYFKADGRTESITMREIINTENPINSTFIPNEENNEKLEIIKKKIGIDFQDSSEVLTIELDDSMKFESANLKIRKESVELIISQFDKEDWYRELDNIYIPKIWRGYIENVDDYMFFMKSVPSKIGKGTNTTDLLMIPNRECDTYTIYIFYIGE